MTTEAERISALFQGCEIGHGTYAKEEKSPGKVKSEIKKTARTLREGATIEMWDQHLAGERSLGIIPIRVDGTCNWGVIDIDEYDLSHRAVAEKITKFGLPFVMCRSKSGGAHVFLFLSEFVPAADMMEKLRELAAILGYGKSEVFPKQTELLLDRGDLGNWLNMPYFKADGGNRYAVDADGKGLSLKRFLDLAEGKRITAKGFYELKPKMADPSADFAEGPPCLQHLSSVGVDEGGRNNALFAFGVLAKKMKPDNWESLLEGWNQKFINPPLTADEVSLVLRSLRKKDYVYKCKEPPIANHCDSMICRGRRFGIGSAGSAPTISSIAILDTEPALYFVRMETGETVECNSDDILTSRAFQRVVLNQLHRIIPMYKQDAFIAKIGELIDNATKIEAPKEVGRLGAFQELLQNFLTDKFSAQTLEEVLLGKPYFDEETKEYVFRVSDLMEFLEARKFKEYNRTQIYTRIRDMGGHTKFTQLNKKGVNLWYLVENVFDPQRESYKTPRLDDSPI